MGTIIISNVNARHTDRTGRVVTSKAHAQWAYHNRRANEESIGTDELPQVKLEPAPPSFMPEFFVHGGDAQKWLDENKDYTVAYYQPCDAVLTVDTKNRSTRTREIGTRITPLKEWRGTAYRRMIESRRHGIAAAIGKDFLIESDEVGQSEVTALARGF